MGLFPLMPPTPRRSEALEPIRVPPTPALRRWSAEHGFSPELVARWGEFYPDLPRLLEALSNPPASYLRLNGLRGDPASTLRRLEGKGFRLSPTPIKGCYRIDEAPFSAGATPEYLRGRYFLQDLSSQLAVMALEPRPGEAIADLCAAPGGKTIAIADEMRDDGVLVAFEPEPSRHRALVSNLARCGVSMASTQLRRGQEAAPLGPNFDAVLLDAPCTGEGVIQRDPSRKQGQLQEFAACAAEQESLFATASRILRPGGRIVYSTCTLAPEENEAQVDLAIRRLGLAVEPLPPALRDLRLEGEPLMPGLPRAGSTEFHASVSETAHALPHLHGCLGFYVARLRKGAA